MEKIPALEHALAKIVEEKLDQMGGRKHAPFGRFVFGEDNGPRVWRLIRAGQRRSITIDETCRMAQFFGQNIAEFIAKIYAAAIEKKLIVPMENLKPEALLVDAVKRLLAEQGARPSRFYKTVFGDKGEEIWASYASGDFKRSLTYAETRDIAAFFKMKYSEFMDFANQ